MAQDRNKFKEMDEVLKEAWTTWDPWMSEAKIDLKHYLNEPWDANEKAYLQQEGRPLLAIPKNTRRFVHLLSGYQRQHRLAINFKPWEGSDALTAEQFSLLMLHALENEGGYHHISRVFNPCIKVGLDWLNIFVDYDEDFVNGDIRFRRTPWTKILGDPLFQELDGSDMNYLFRRERLTKRQLKMLMPDKKISDFKPKQISHPIQLDPGKHLFGTQPRWDLTEWWQREQKLKSFLVHRETGEMRQFETPGKNEQIRLQLVMQQYPELAVIKKRIPVVTLQLWIGEDLAWEGEDPIGCEDFPYVPHFCYLDPEYDELKLKLQGILRCLRDSNKEFNKRRSQILHIINTMAYSGWKYEEGALADETVIYDATGAGVLLKVKRGRMEDVEPIDRSGFPPELIKIEELLAQDPVDITGINAELLSMVEKDMPGITVQLRQRQGLIAIQEIFDNLRLFKKGVGRRYQKCVQNNYSAEKVQRIINQEPSPQFYTRQFQKYDCSIDEAINSPTQRDYMFQKMVWFHQNVAPVHPMIMLELSDIPEKYRETQGKWMMAQLQQAMGMPPQGGGGGQMPQRQLPAPAAGAM